MKLHADEQGFTIQLEGKARIEGEYQHNCVHFTYIPVQPIFDFILSNFSRIYRINYISEQPVEIELLSGENFFELDFSAFNASLGLEPTRHLVFEKE